MPVCKLFQFSNHLIVAGIAVIIAYHLPDFLQGIHDNQLGVTVFPGKFFKLFIQTAADHLGTGSKVESVCPLHTEHAEHPALQTAFIIFQRKIEDCSLMNLVTPQILPSADMVSNLRHKKRFTDFWSSGKDICSSIEQVFNHRRLYLKHIVHQLVQGYSVQVSRVAHALYPAVHFFQAFLRIYNFIVDFSLRSGYTNVSVFRD